MDHKVDELDETAEPEDAYPAYQPPRTLLIVEQGSVMSDVPDHIDKIEIKPGAPFPVVVPQVPREW